MIEGYLSLKTDAATAPVQGESKDSFFHEKIEITHFATGGGKHEKKEADDEQGSLTVVLGRSYCPFHFEIKKEIDAASPYLFNAYCKTFGRFYVPEVNVFKRAEVAFRKAGGGGGAYRTVSGVVYLKMIFEQVVLTSYSLDSDPEGTANETVKFAFRTCQLQYQPQTPEGGTEPPKELKGWDFLKNKPA